MFPAPTTTTTVQIPTTTVWPPPNSDDRKNKEIKNESNNLKQITAHPLIFNSPSDPFKQAVEFYDV